MPLITKQYAPIDNEIVYSIQVFITSALSLSPKAFSKASVRLLLRTDTHLPRKFMIRKKPLLHYTFRSHFWYYLTVPFSCILARYGPDKIPKGGKQMSRVCQYISIPKKVQLPVVVYHTIIWPKVTMVLSPYLVSDLILQDFRRVENDPDWLIVNLGVVKKR